ncbi:hypothetical protein PR048_031609 [Dryococelus australis]|uniref:Uncharacterized protein n=1 Tax=Dryococelus australis TaxID=614101 RepID=A0ABQ9G5S3_9NEOP|nr:hypothetical protein PR048_031609 [Dryococelus australis]
MFRRYYSSNPIERGGTVVTHSTPVWEDRSSNPSPAILISAFHGSLKSLQATAGMGHLKPLVYATPLDDEGHLRYPIVAGCETFGNFPGIHQRIRLPPRLSLLAPFSARSRRAGEGRQHRPSTRNTASISIMFVPNRLYNMRTFAKCQLFKVDNLRLHLRVLTINPKDNVIGLIQNHVASGRTLSSSVGCTATPVVLLETPHPAFSFHIASSSWAAEKYCYRIFFDIPSESFLTTCKGRERFGHLASRFSTFRPVLERKLIGAGIQGRGKQEYPEKTRRQAPSSSTIPTCENPEVNPLGIEFGFAVVGGERPSICATVAPIMIIIIMGSGDVVVRILASHQCEAWFDSRRLKSPPDFRTWESCQTMPLVGGIFSGISRFIRSCVSVLPRRLWVVISRSVRTPGSQPTGQLVGDGTGIVPRSAARHALSKVALGSNAPSEQVGRDLANPSIFPRALDASAGGQSRDRGHYAQRRTQALFTIDSELQCQTIVPDFVIIGFSGLPPATVANFKHVFASKNYSCRSDTARRTSIWKRNSRRTTNTSCEHEGLPLTSTIAEHIQFRSCDRVFNDGQDDRRHERTACAKSPFRAVKHCGNGHSRFTLGDTSENHVKNCDDSTAGSRQVLPAITLSASAGIPIRQACMTIQLKLKTERARIEYQTGSEDDHEDIINQNEPDNSERAEGDGDFLAAPNPPPPPPPYICCNKRHEEGRRR